MVCLSWDLNLAARLQSLRQEISHRAGMICRLACLQTSGNCYFSFPGVVCVERSHESLTLSRL